MHCRCSRLENVYVQLQGTRQFSLFSPLEVSKLYPMEGSLYSEIDVEHPDYNIFPLYKDARPLVVDREPGVILCIAVFWWHWVRAGKRANLAVNFWFPANQLLSAFYQTIMTND